MAEITPISSQLARLDVARELQRDGAQRQGDRVRDDVAREVRDGTASVIQERQDVLQAVEDRARREDAARDAEVANSVRANIDLSADAIFDPDLPRGSIIDIVA